MESNNETPTSKGFQIHSDSLSLYTPPREFEDYTGDTGYNESELERIDQYNNRGTPEAGYGDVFWASMVEGYMSGTVMSFARKKAVEDLGKAGPVESIEYLNNKYPGLNTDKELTEQQAIHIMDVRKEQHLRQKIINSASSSILKGMVTPFVGGMIGGMGDPADFGVGAALGGITSTILRSGTAGAISQRVLKESLKAGATKREAAIKAAKAAIGAKPDPTAMARFTLAAVENTTANAVTEVFALQAAQSEMKEYTAGEAFRNVVTMSIGMTTFMHGLGAIGRGLSRMGDKHIDATYKITKFAADNGINATKVAEMMERRVLKRLEIDDNIVRSVNDVFGDRAPEILGSSDDLKDVVTIINKEIVDGDLDPVLAERFKRVAEEYGVEPERWSVVEEDSPVNFSEREINEMLTEMNSDSFKVPDEDANIEFRVDEGKEAILEAEEIAQVDEIRARIVEEPDAEDLVLFKEDDNLVSFHEESQKIIDAFIKCRGA